MSDQRSERESRAQIMLHDLQQSAVLDMGGPRESDREPYQQQLRDFMAKNEPELLAYVRWRDPSLDEAKARATLDCLAAECEVVGVSDPFERVTMGNLIKKFERFAPTLGLTPMSRPVFGSVPLGQANGRTYLFGGTDTDPHLIVFQEGVFGCTYLLCLLVAKVLTSYLDDGRVFIETDDYAVPVLLQRTPGIHERFAELLDAYVIAGHPWRAPRQHPARAWGENAARFLDVTQVFIMAHEFGHIYEQHTVATTIAEQQAQEYAADRFAVRVVCANLREYRHPLLPLAAAGPAILFGGMEQAEKTVTMLVGREGADPLTESPYPPPASRLQACLTALSKELDAAQWEYAARLAQAISTLFRILWEAAKPRYEAMRLAGTKPDRRWLVKPPSPQRS